MNKYWYSQQGFTLLELMIAITIVAILGGIAVPSYLSYQETARLSDGSTDVYRVMGQQERFYMNNLVYTASLGNEGLGYELTNGKLYSPDGYFEITAGVCVLPDGTFNANVTQCVRIQATGLDELSNHLFWIQSNGLKSTNLE